MPKNSLSLQLEKMHERLRNGKIRLEKQRQKLDELEIQIQMHQVKIEAAKKQNNKKNSLSN